MRFKGVFYPIKMFNNYKFFIRYNSYKYLEFYLHKLLWSQFNKQNRISAYPLKECATVNDLCSHKSCIVTEKLQ